MTGVEERRGEKVGRDAPDLDGRLAEHDRTLCEQPSQANRGKLAVLDRHFRHLRNNEVRQNLRPQPTPSSVDEHIG